MALAWGYAMARHQLALVSKCCLLKYFPRVLSATLDRVSEYSHRPR